MGQFVIDHGGDLSALEIGRDAAGKPYSSLARAFASVGREPAQLIRVSHGQLRIEHASDLAAALKIERPAAGAALRHRCRRGTEAARAP